MAEKKGKSGWILFFVFLFVLGWLVVSRINLHLSEIRAENSKHFAQEMVKMVGYVIEMSRELAEITNQWKGLAYQLNPEAAEAMEENIQKHYRNKMQQDQESKVWVKL